MKSPCRACGAMWFEGEKHRLADCRDALVRQRDDAVSAAVAAVLCAAQLAAGRKDYLPLSNRDVSRLQEMKVHIDHVARAVAALEEP